MQAIEGLINTYSAGATGIFDVYRDATNRLELSYTPSVNVWWEVHANVWLAALTAGWMFCYLRFNMAGTLASGHQIPDFITTGYGAADTDHTAGITKLFKLTAGVAYTCKVQAWAGGGYLFNYYRGPESMWMHGKAWAR